MNTLPCKPPQPQSKSSVYAPLVVVLITVSVSMGMANLRPVGKAQATSPVYGILLANKISADREPTSFLFDQLVNRKDFCALPLLQKEE